MNLGGGLGQKWSKKRKVRVPLDKVRVNLGAFLLKNAKVRVDERGKD